MIMSIYADEWKLLSIKKVTQFQVYKGDLPFENLIKKPFTFWTNVDREGDKKNMLKREPLQSTRLEVLWSIVGEGVPSREVFLYL